MPLSSRVSFSKNSPVYRLLTFQLGGLSEGCDERVHSTRSRAVLRAGVKCLRPIRPVRRLCRLHWISARSMPRFDQQVMSEDFVIDLNKTVHEKACFLVQMGELFVREAAHN